MQFQFVFFSSIICVPLGIKFHIWHTYFVVVVYYLASSKLALLIECKNLQWKHFQLLVALLLISSNQGMWWGHCATFSFWWNCQWNFLLACHGPWQFGVSSIIESDPGHDEEGRKWKGTFFFLPIHMYAYVCILIVGIISTIDILTHLSPFKFAGSSGSVMLLL